MVLLIEETWPAQRTGVLLDEPILMLGNMHEQTLALAASCFFWIEDVRFHVLLLSIFSAFVALMVFLIAASDRPFRGSVSVSAAVSGRPRFRSCAGRLTRWATPDSLRLKYL